MRLIRVFGGPLDGQSIPLQGRRFKATVTTDGRTAHCLYVVRRERDYTDPKRPMVDRYEVDLSGPDRRLIVRRFSNGGRIMSLPRSEAAQ